MKQPFINDMFPELEQPWEHNYKKRTKEIILYTYYHRMPRDNYYDDGSDDDDSGYDYEESHYLNINKDQPKLDRSKLDEINLQFLINKIPEGLSPADIKIKINIDASDMAVEGSSITFYYTKNFPADPEGYERDKKKWEEAVKVYEKEKSKYDTWKKEQEIKELEDKLNKLKK